MDLPIYMRVLWRFRAIVLAGVALACLLAFLSFVRVSISGPDHFSYRQGQQWASYSTLFVTQKGFPWGQLQIGDAGKAATPDATGSSQASGDPLRFSSLAIIYSKLIQSDGVRQLMLRDGPIIGHIETAPVTTDANSSDALPLISVAGLSDTPEHARQLVSRATSSFLTYLDEQQSANGIPPDNRVVVTVVNKPGNDTLMKDRSKTLPIVVFLTVVMMSIALCFVLENLRPRMRPAGPGDITVPDITRKTA